jgi:DNA-binding transcriptional ArsR family regulator
MTLRDSGNPTVAADLGLPDEEEFASATAHPIAAQALKMMLRRPVTAKDVAEALGEAPEEVARHLADLRQRGLIQIGSIREVEGRSEPCYTGPFAPFLDKEEWGELSPAERRFQLQQIANLLMRDIEAALEAKTLDAWPDFHFCQMPFWMDDQGWEELRAIYDDALLRAVRIREEATARLQRAGEKGKHGTLGQLLFELPDSE